jgi:uncharacterized protein (TIGR00369 family)
VTASVLPVAPLPLDALLEAFSTSVEAADGVARLSMRRTDVTVGGVRNSINGGVLAALVELAGHCALGSVLNEGEVIEGTVDVSVSYLRASLGDPTVAEARVLRKGSRLCVCSVEVRNSENGDLNVVGKVSLGLAPRVEAREG